MLDMYTAEKMEIKTITDIPGSTENNRKVYTMDNTICKIKKK